MIEYNYNNSSMLQNHQSVSRNKHQKRLTCNNINQNEIDAKQTRISQERSILPFSLKHKHHNKPNYNPYSQDHDSHNNTNHSLDQSGLSQNILKRFQSRNAIGFYRNVENLEGEEQRVTDGNSYQRKTNNSGHVSYKVEGTEVNTRQKLANQQKISSYNDTQLIVTDNSNLIMLQIHITIAKKKYTLKVSNQITTVELQSLIQNFLQQNSISNPLKKSHNKTKRSIVEMVQNKIRDGNSTEYKRLTREAREQQVRDKIGNEENDSNRQNYDQRNVIEEQIDGNYKQEKIKSVDDNGITHKQAHVGVKPSMVLKLNQPALKTQNNDSIIQDNKFQQQEYQVCSPSFKSSIQHVEHKSPMKRTSQFSPEPKHQDNKYQKIVANYYNQTVGENGQRFQQSYVNKNAQRSSKSPLQMSYSEHYPVPVLGSPTFTQNNSKFQETINISQNDFEQQKAKSVYQKWKQREKSKEINGKTNENHKLQYPLRQRKMTDNSFVSQMSEQKKQQKREKNWNNVNGRNRMDKGIQRAIHTVSVQEQKQNQKKLPPKSPMNNKNRSKQNFNMNRSTLDYKKVPSYHQRNKTMTEEDYSPNKIMNKTQVFGSKMVDNEGFQSNKYIRGVKQTVERSVTPKKTKALSTNQPKTPTNNENQSKVYTICDEDSYTVHEMSPDHFYKQGLIFQAKKKQQLEDKFKSLYPFTTRNIKDLHEIENGGSRNGTMRNGKENSGVNEKSKEKCFSSKLSMNKNVTTKSSVNINLDEKEKSALHQRLYQENKAKQTKMTTSEANQRLIKLSKPSQNQTQLKIMQENLKNIKGLSQEKKIKLIQKNIKIKEKIKEKDRMIDQELQKMIKQGKVKSAYHLAQVPKSPFRKTQFF